MVDVVQKVGCCQFWKISVDFSLHHANIDTCIEKCIMLQWYINIILLYWPLTFYCVFPPLLNIGESCRNALPLFHWFHNKKRPKRPSNWTFFFLNLTLKQCPHEPFAPYLVIATPVNFLDGIFGYTSRLALHWYQICVVPFRAVKTGLSHGLNSKPSTYRPVNQLITLMGEMNQNIIHSKNNIGSTLLSNNAASDASEWFLEWFWCCELLCLRLLFIVPISFIRWRISFHYNQNLAPDRKKNTRTERKLPRSRPDPFSWARTGPIPGLSKIWPRDPSRVGVARSGPGIPDGPGCPARL